MKFDIKFRWSNEVKFTLKGETRNAAIKKAIQDKVNLSGCDLRGSNLSDSNLSGCDLSDCDLSDCDLSGCDLSGCDLSDCDLSDSNLSGSNLSGCDLSGCDLSGCDLSGSNLSGSNLSGSNLSDCDLSGSNLSDCDLSGCDLSGSNLSGCDLSGSNLSGSNLSDCDLSGVPVIKDIHKAVYEAASKPGCLAMNSWHMCATTHCRAGWVVTLAGEAGKAMEYCIGTPAAAALIYIKSDPKLEKVPNFYAANEEALDDMKRLAEAK